MKNKPWRMAGALALIFLVISCSEQQSVKPPVKGGVNMNLDFRMTTSDGARISLDQLEEIQSVFITIEGPEGGIAEERQLDLLRFNDHFVTETIVLPEGDYNVTRFLVLDETDNVLFVTPLRSSAAAHLVEAPLPVDFAIRGEATTSVKLEVVPVDGREPVYFGYTTFDFNIVYPCDKVSAEVNGETWCGSAKYVIAYGNTPPVFELLFRNGTSRFGIRTRYLGQGVYDLEGTSTDYYRYGQVLVHDVISGTMTITSAPGAGNRKVSGTFAMKLENGNGDTVEITNGVFNDVTGSGY